MPKNKTADEPPELTTEQRDKLRACLQGHNRKADILRRQLYGLDDTEEMPFPHGNYSYSPGAQAIVNERAEQLTTHGYKMEDDARYTTGELLRAASSYMEYAHIQAMGEDRPTKSLCGQVWPWHQKSFKPRANIIKNLQKAGAFIAAEIDRLKLKQANEEKNRQEKNRSRKK